MKSISVALASVALSAIALAQPPDSIQQGYMSNLAAGDSYLNVTNSGIGGAALGFGPAGAAGNICANIYVFDPAQEMVACCTCLTTPDGLYSFSGQGDLINDPLSVKSPVAIVIKVTATVPTNATFTQCDPRNPGALTSGIRAWATTLHAGPSGSVMTENALAQAKTLPLGGGVEQAQLPIECMFVLALGSGNGACNTCKNQGLTGAKQ